MTIENLNNYTYDEAKYFYTKGVISLELWEEYQLIWRNASPRFSHLSSGFEIITTKGNNAND